MIVDGYCRTCKTEYDAHWHNLPSGANSWEIVPCPKCGSNNNVRITTDECLDTFDEED
jgi:Zn finger protein HypA/HybF involved in hydrogenase expression